MRYVERPPPADLAPWIEGVWTLRGNGSGEDTVLPDGRTEIVLNFGDVFRRRTADGIERQPRALFVGPSARVTMVHAGDHVEVLGFRLRPGAARSAFGMPIHALVDQIPALEDVAPGLAHLLERSAADHRRLDHALQLLSRALHRGATPDPRVQRGIERLEAGASVDQAARAACLSVRQLQRRFLDEVGLTPRTFGRVVRVQRAAIAAPHAARVGWARVAVACGFYDQAHLIRDFKASTGDTPGAFFAATHPLATVFAAEAGAESAG